MAARTLEREAQRGGDDDGLRIVQHPVLIFRELVRVEVGPRGIHRGPEESGGYERFLDLGRPLLRRAVILQLVARYLLAEETVVRLIRIQAADHVIAITPGVRADQVLLQNAFAVGIPGSIEPVPRPPLAV